VRIVPTKNGAPFAGRAVFIWDSERDRFAAGSHPSEVVTPRKKIPALRRANDTSINVSERSAN
jgi:hypothetical protein